MNALKYIFPALVSCPVLADIPSVDLFTSWQSRYVSEGRDNLDGNHFLVSGLVLARGNLDAELIYGVEDNRTSGAAERYKEWNAVLGYSNSIGPINWRGSYKRLWFPSSDEDDSEWTLDLSTEIASNLTAAMAYTYATEAEGGFIEVALEYVASCGTGCNLVPYLMVSDNRGFVADADHGLNNIQSGLALIYQTNNGLGFIAEANYSHPFEEDKEQGLEELLWWNLGLNYYFD